MKKQCSKCKIFKVLEDFHRRRTSNDGRGYTCKECHKKVNSLHYKNNKTAYIDRATSRRKESRKIYSEWKRRQGCTFCSENDPCCLELHHVDSSKKEATVSELITTHGFTSKITQREITKCMIVCSNCHRKIHRYGIKNYRKKFVAPSDGGNVEGSPKPLS